MSIKNGIYEVWVNLFGRERRVYRGYSEEMAAAKMRENERLNPMKRYV